MCSSDLLATAATDTSCVSKTFRDLVARSPFRAVGKAVGTATLDYHCASDRWRGRSCTRRLAPPPAHHSSLRGSVVRNHSAERLLAYGFFSTIRRTLCPGLASSCSISSR